MYGFHADYLLDDEDVFPNTDLTSTAHAILAEPAFDVAMFQIKTAIFFAIISERDYPNVAQQTADAQADNDPEDNNPAPAPAGVNRGWAEVTGEIPEYFFVYAEPALKVGGFMKFGIPVEFHTNTLDSDNDDNTKTIDVGGRLYLTPVENLDITAFGMVDIPVGDNDDDVGLRFGAETVFNF